MLCAWYCVNILTHIISLSPYYRPLKVEAHRSVNSISIPEYQILLRGMQFLLNNEIS